MAEMASVFGKDYFSFFIAALFTFFFNSNFKITESMNFLKIHKNKKKVDL